jgi:hypothetical protein
MRKDKVLRQKEKPHGNDGPMQRVEVGKYKMFLKITKFL